MKTEHKLIQRVALSGLSLRLYVGNYITVVA